VKEESRHCQRLGSSGVTQQLAPRPALAPLSIALHHREGAAPP